jgi:hypothetical protein
MVYVRRKQGQQQRVTEKNDRKKSYQQTTDGLERLTKGYKWD